MKPSKQREATAAIPANLSKQSETTLHDKIAIIDWHLANGKKQVKTVHHFQSRGFPQLSQPTLSKWLKNEVDLRSKALSGSDPSVMRFRLTKNPRFEEAMSLWVDQMEACQFSGLTGEAIKQVASIFYDKLDIPPEDRLQLSNGWLTSFKSRHGLRFAHFHGEAASASIESVVEEQARVSALLTAALKEGVTLDDVYNMDETSFFYAATPDRGLCREAHPGTKQSKTRLTLALTVNATGTDRLEPLFIGTAKKPRCFRNKTASQHGFQHYYHNKKAWMTGDLFRTWLLQWNASLQLQGRKIILFLDNFSGHKANQEDLPNIRLEFFAPNLTAHVQPCDAGIIRTFKALYRRHFVLRVVDKLVTGQVNSDLFKIDQLQAMHLAKRSWKDVSESTISNCWRHTKILPGSVDIVVPDGEQQGVVGQLQNVMEQLRMEANGHGLVIDLMEAKDFVAQGESDELAHAHLNLNDIADFVMESDEEEDDQTDEDVGLEPVTEKEAFSTVLCLKRYLEELGDSEDEELMCLLDKKRLKLQIKLSSAKKQAAITRFFKPVQK